MQSTGRPLFKSRSELFLLASFLLLVIGLLGFFFLDKLVSERISESVLRLAFGSCLGLAWLLSFSGFRGRVPITPKNPRAQIVLAAVLWSILLIAWYFAIHLNHLSSKSEP